MNIKLIKPTKKDFEEYLNDIDANEDDYVMNGKMHHGLYYKNKYGTCLRINSPVEFEKAFWEWQHGE